MRGEQREGEMMRASERGGGVQESLRGFRQSPKISGILPSVEGGGKRDEIRSTRRSHVLRLQQLRGSETVSGIQAHGRARPGATKM